MSDKNQGKTNNSGTSTVNVGSTVSSNPGTSSTQQSKMGVETKLSSSSREMRNMAEKMRRDKLNNYVAEIADIVPLCSGANKRIDKTSVLRLAANYIRMHKIFKDDDDPSSKLPLNLGVEMTHSVAEAVGGFLLVVTSSGKVVYITEAVDQFFGHTQVDLLGHSIYNVIHPDDHDIFQKQLLPKENCRRSFFCRMMEKALSRNDPGRYEIIHVVGQLRPLPQDQQASSSSSPSCSIRSPSMLSPGETNFSSDHDDEESSDNDGEMQPLKMINRTGTHMLVSFVRVVKDRPITELSLVESTRDEYITRHGMDGKILYTDHRISFVTGLMPSEVVGTSAFNYMHQDDILWSIVAQKLMFSSNQGQGIVSYRLRCRDGAHVTLRSRGFLEVNKQTEQVESFVCINTVLSIKEATSEIKNQRRKLLPVITCTDTEDHLGSISSSLPPELLLVMKQLMSPETLQKMIASVKRSDLLPEARISEVPEVLPVDTGSSLTPIQDTEADVVKGPDDNPDCSFQSKPKRLCSEVPTCRHSDPYSSAPHSCKDKWYRMTKKRPIEDSFSIDVSKNFSLDSPPYQKTVALSPERCWKPETQTSLPTQTNYMQSDMVFDNPNISQNLITPVGYRQQLAENVPPSNCSSRKEESSLSPSLVGLKISSSNSSENPYPVCPQRIGESVLSPENKSLDERGALSLLHPSSAIQNPYNAIPSPCPQSHGTDMYNQSTNPNMSFTSTFSSQNMCQGLTSAGNNHNRENKPSLSTRLHEPRRGRNSSNNKASSKNISQYDVSSPEKQSSLLVQSQFFPWYPQQTPSCAPYPAMQSGHQFTTSLGDQSFSQSSQASTSGMGPGHSHTGSLYAPISSSQTIPFCEPGSLGMQSVPEPTIPEQRLSFEDPMSKDIGNKFSDGHFQHYSTHNHQGDKLL